MMNDNARSEERFEKGKPEAAKGSGAFARVRKGLTEGLVIASMCTGFLLKSGCTYEVPPLDNIPDAGSDVSVTEHDGGVGGHDAGTGGHDAGVGGHDAGTEEDAGVGGHDGGAGGLDAGTGGHDAGTGGMDAGTGGMDAGTGGMDAGVGGMDAGTGGMDAGSGGMDAGAGGMDAGAGGSDAGIVCGAVTTDSYFGPINTTTPRNVAGYNFSYEGVSGGGGALMSINCGGPDIETSLDCPLSVETDVVRAADDGTGRRIRITPHTVTASYTSITIVVESL